MHHLPEARPSLHTPPASDGTHPQRRRWEGLWAALLGVTAMSVVQSGSAHIAGNDGYYHVKMAALLPELGFVQSFPWLRWTIISDQFVSHHYGFHTVLAPWVWLTGKLAGDPALGGKLASLLAMGATFALLAVILRRLGTPHLFLWLLLLGAAPWHFWLRQAYVRAPMVALPLLLLAVWWNLCGRTVAIALLAFLFTQVYGGGVLFPLVPIAFLGGAWLAGDALKTPLRQCIAAFTGVALGLVINPYFPANFSFLFTQLFETGLGAPADVGSEWKPYVGWALMMQSAIVGAAWLWCLIRRLVSAAPARADELALLLLNLAFLLLTLKSRRFVEYWPVFALLSAAAFYARSDQAVWPVNAAAFFARPFANRMSVWGVGLVLATCATANLLLTRQHIEPSHDLAAIDEAMRFLRGYSQPSSLVFTDDWDIFPACFYYNHHNTYAVGLDPEFTRSRYPALWERYRRITRAELPAKLPDSYTDEANREITYDDIAGKFGADYVLVAKDHRPLFRALTARGEPFRLIYPPQWSSGEKQPAIALFEVRTPTPRPESNLAAPIGSGKSIRSLTD